MMKRIGYCLLLLFVALGCIPDLPVQPVPVDEGYPEGAKVTLQFSVSAGDAMPATKALGEKPELDSLYLAVFGSSGYLKEYVKADIIDTLPTYVGPDTVLNFQATLTLSDKERTVHFIGNGPSTLDFGYASDILPQLLSENGGQAFWQMLEHVTIEGTKQDGSYLPTPATNAQFENISLVRNFAKIVLSAAPDSHFEPDSFAVFNVPSKGSVVPFDGDFIRNYQNYGFTELTDIRHYPGNLPDSTDFVGFPQEWNSRKVDVGEAVYLYERPVPTEQFLPSYVIVHGEYTDTENPEQNGWYYYKIDLAQGGSYYPIYRNFKYQVKINKILSRGHTTPEAAAASAGSADVSADITTSHLNDISDGEARLVVQPWMSYAFTKRQVNNKVLNVKFFSDVMSGDPDMSYGSVTCEKLPMPDGEEDVIESVSIGYPVLASGTEKGWRTITFSTTEPGDPGTPARTQVLRVIGEYLSETADTLRLYRDVRITLQPLQRMQLSVVNPDNEAELVPRGIGRRVRLNISIPVDLDESVFPITFVIEPEDMSLTPDNQIPNNNLPVTAQTSISDHAGYAGKRAFQYNRTLTYAEYKTLPQSLDLDGEPIRTFTCQFKTTRRDNATTIWVANEFFSKAYVTYANSDPFKFFFIEAQASCKVSCRNSMRYAIDEVDDWKDYTAGSDGVSLRLGERMYILSTEKDWSEKPFTVTGTFAIGGNLASLIEGEQFKEQGAAAEGWTFQGFMRGNTKLVDASELELPMVTVPQYGYEGMFSGCSNMEDPPSTLPAKILKHHAYYQMFYNCTKLSSAPTFPHDENETYSISGDSTCYQMFYKCSFTEVTGQLYNATVSLSKACFQDMFSTCSQLATIPEDFLPATTLAVDCYRGMFQSTNITRAPDLLVEIIKDYNNCYRYMFYGCKSLNFIKCLAKDPSPQNNANNPYTSNWVTNAGNGTGTFVTNNNDVMTGSWSRGGHGIPSGSGWTVMQVSEE